MTLVKITRRDGEIRKVECDGHTNYNVQGEDIVCAALSSVVQTAALGLMAEAGADINLKRDEDRGYMCFTVPDGLTPGQRHDCGVILNTMLLGVSDLYEGYSDFIELEVN